MKKLLPTILLSACVPSFAHKEPLRYAELSYTSVKGEEWNEKFLELDSTAKLHALAKGTSVCYVELNPTGKAPLVFIHGLGSYLKFWRYQLDAFAAKGHRVIALDMLGYGKSDKPSRFPYTTEAMADVVHELVTRLGLEQPILVGHSMGGQTALSYAIRYPERLGGLILTAPAGFERFSPREQRWFETVFSTALIKGTPEDGIWRSIRKNNFARWKDEYAWLVEERVRTAKSPEFDAYAYANVKSVRGLAHNDFVRENLEKVAAPTLIIHGDHDRLIPNPFMHGGTTRALMAEGQARIKGSKLVSLEGCGHTIQMDCAEEYNDALLRFIAAELR